MNLLSDRWLPAGDGIAVAPSEIGGRALTVYDISWPRSDFDGATLEFLIGALQTMFAPETHKEWVKYYITPPEVAELREAFAPFASAFELLGDGPRFMQDPTVLDKEPNNATYLLIEYPGENASKQNTDLFVHRQSNAVLSLPAAAMAVFALQTYASGGGPGFRTGVRGGGPLTTLLTVDEPEGRTEYGLWRSLWLNVLPLDAFDVDRPSVPDPAVFPWMRSADQIRAMAKDFETMPGAVNPLQMYWGTPRRLWLQTSSTPGQLCLVTGVSQDVMVDGVSTHNYGVNYVGWQHSLSPHRKDEKQNAQIPLKGKARPDYRDWLGWTLGAVRQGKEISPARTVAEFETPTVRKHGRRLVTNDKHPDRRTVQMLAFGYEMDNAKARAYFRTSIPVLHHDGAAAGARIMMDDINKMLNGADYAHSVLREAIKAAIFDGKRSTGDDGWIAAELMSRTEPAFRTAITNLQSIPTGAIWEMKAGAIQDFGLVMQRQALDIFAERAESISPDQRNMEKIVRAKRKLVMVIRAPKFWSTMGVENPNTRELSDAN